jgi:hypothetical protein
VVAVDQAAAVNRAAAVRPAAADSREVKRLRRQPS